MGVGDPPNELLPISNPRGLQASEQPRFRDLRSDPPQDPLVVAPVASLYVCQRRRCARDLDRELCGG